MGNGSAVQVEIAASFGQFQSGLAAASRSMQEMVRSMQGSMGGIAPAVKPASESVGGFTETIAHFKREQVQQGRMVGFYVQELAEFTGASKSAQLGMSGMSLAALELLGGLTPLAGALAAFEILKVIAVLWRESGEAARKAAEEAEKEWKQRMAGIKSAVESVKKATQELKGYDSQSIANAEAILQKNREIAALKKADPSGQRWQEMDRLKKERDEVVALASAYQRSKAARDVAKSSSGADERAAEYAAMAADLEDELAASIEKAASSMAALNLQAAEYNHMGTVAVEDAKLKVELLRLELQLKKAVTEEERAAIQAQMKAAQDTRDENVRRAKITDQFSNTAGLDESAGYDLSKSPTDMGADEAHRKFVKNLAEQRRAMEENVRVGMRLGEAVGRSFIDMATGAKSAGEAMRAIGSAVADTLIQIAMKKVEGAILAHVMEKPVKVGEVTAAAGVAGAEAAASVAATPFIGPALAVAAMAETSAAVLSAMIPLASASGGFDIGNYNPLTQLHAGEMVLPKPLADKFRNLTDDASSRRTFVFNISAVDAPGVRRLLLDNQGAVAEALISAARNRRI